MTEANTGTPGQFAGPTQFAGKVAAITGGTQGVGEAVARLLAARGAAGLTSDLEILRERLEIYSPGPILWLVLAGCVLALPAALGIRWLQTRASAAA